MLSKRALPGTRQETKGNWVQDEKYYKNWKNKQKNKKHMHARMYTLQQQVLEN
jgi:hypothetical protein